MGRPPEVTPRGLRELIQEPKEAGDGLTDLRPPLAAAAKFVEETAAALVPRGTSSKLAHSIRSSVTKKAGVVRAGRASVPYAGVIHYGWPQHNIEESHFLIRAAHTREPQWVQAFTDYIQDQLNNIKGSPHA